MLPGHRAHRKSRHGCQQCKIRKVKCDENKPSCQNCVRRAISCSFGVPGPAHSASTASPQASDAPKEHPSPEPFFAGQTTAAVPDLNLLDLELLHHYSTSTCYTLARHPVLQTVWRVQVPKIGLSAPFVLRAVLALSALHLHYLNPDRQEQTYLSRAILHHDIALQSVTPILPRLAQENSAALLLFSSLTCMITCAEPRQAGNFLLTEHGRLASWLVAFRGTKAVTDYADPTWKAGVLSPLFSIGSRKLELRDGISTANQDFMQDLMMLIRDEISDQEELGAYTNAVERLRKSFAVVLDPNLQSCETSDVFIWLFEISNEYLALLRGEQPVALVIFAYYCVIIRRLEWAWWLEGWSAHAISGIYSLLDEVHRNWIQWPMEQLGWVP